jgi:hypothetical protein
VIAVVNPSVVSGVLAAPPSKSYTHRAVAIATLSTDKSVIRNPPALKGYSGICPCLRDVRGGCRELRGSAGG